MNDPNDLVLVRRADVEEAISDRHTVINQMGSSLGGTDEDDAYLARLEAAKAGRAKRTTIDSEIEPVTAADWLAGIQRKAEGDRIIGEIEGNYSEQVHADLVGRVPEPGVITPEQFHAGRHLERDLLDAIDEVRAESGSDKVGVMAKPAMSGELRKMEGVRAATLTGADGRIIVDDVRGLEVFWVEPGSAGLTIRQRAISWAQRLITRVRGS